MRYQNYLQPLNARVIIACLVASSAASSAAAQTAREVRGAAAVEPLQNEPPAKIVIDPPLTKPLSHGRAVIQYRTENLHMVPLLGPTINQLTKARSRSRCLPRSRNRSRTSD